MPDTNPDAALAARLAQQQQSDASNKVVGTQDFTPQQGADAQQYGPQVGTHPDVALQVPQTKADAELQARLQAVGSSPPLQRWVSGANDAQVAAASDALPGMANVAAHPAFKFLDPANDFMAGLEEPLRQYEALAQKAAAKGPLGAEEAGPELGAASLGVVAGFIGGLINTYAAPIGRAYVASGFSQQGIPALGIKSDVQQVLDDAKQPGLIGDSVRAQLAAGAAPEQIVTQRATGAAALILTPQAGRLGRGRAPPIELGPAVSSERLGPQPLSGPPGSVPAPEVPAEVIPSPYTSVRQAAAKVDEAAVEHLQATVDAEMGDLIKRSPETAEGFLEQQTRGAVAHVDPERLMELAQQGHEPFPELTSQILAASEDGRDVEVPLARYLTATAGQPYAQTLNEATAFREGGTSTGEAQTAPTTVPQVAQPTTEVPADLTKEESARAQELIGTAKGALQQAVSEHFLSPLFKDAAAVGMDKDQFARYSARIGEVVQRANDKLTQKVYQQILRERQGDFQALVPAKAEAIRGQIEALPVVQAMRALGQTGFKLDRDLSEFMAPEPTSRLPKGILRKGGNHPDDAAEQLGFASGPDLINALADLHEAQRAMGARTLDEYVATQARGAAHAAVATDLGFDASREAALVDARSILNEPFLTNFLTDELKALADQLGMKGMSPASPLTRANLEARAREGFGRITVQEAISLKGPLATFTRLQKYVTRAGTGAEKALLKGDVVSAFRWKQVQVLNQLRLQEAVAFAKEYRRALRTLSTWGGSPPIAGMDPNVAAILQGEVYDLHMPLARDFGELQRYLQQAPVRGPFELVGAMNEEGWATDPSNIPPEVRRFNGALLPHFTVDQFRDYMNMLNSIAKFGAERQSITVQGREWQLTAIGNEVQARADELGRKYTDQQLLDYRRQLFAGLRSGFKSILVGNLRPEVYLSWLDGNRVGTLMQTVVKPLQDGKYTETDLTDRWIKAMKAVTEGGNFLRSMHEKMSVPDFMQYATPRGTSVEVLRTRGNLRRALLHLGSETARDKMLKGYGWGETQEQWLLDNATQEDWNFARAFWDENERLFQLADAMYMRVRGYGLPRDVLRDVDTGRFGTIKGGHIHLTYESALNDLSRMVDANDQGLLASKERSDGTGGDLLSNHPTSSLPGAFYGLKRTNYIGPVSLNPDTLSTGVAETIHDIAFREALIAAQRVVTDPRVGDAMTTVLGPEYAAQMTPWLRYIAQERIMYDPATESGAQLVRSFASNIVFAKVAYNLSSVLKHSAVGLSHMTTEVGSPLALQRAFGDVVGAGARNQMWRDFIDANSGEVRGLAWNVDNSLRDAISRDALSDGAYQAYKDFGYATFTFSKLWEARITWLAKYRTAIADNGDHALSVQIANKAVRDTQGAGSPVDLPPLLRRHSTLMGELGRASYGLVMGFRGTGPNRLFTMKRLLEQAGRAFGTGDVGAGMQNAGQAAGMAFGFTVLAAALLATYEVFLRGGGNPKERSTPKRAFEEFAWGLMEQGPGGLVGLSQFVDAAHYADSHNLFEAPIESVKQAANFHSYHWVYSALAAFADITGALPESFAHLTQALVDQAHPTHLQPQERNPAAFNQRALLSRTPHYERAPHR